MERLVSFWNYLSSWGDWYVQQPFAVVFRLITLWGSLWPLLRWTDYWGWMIGWFCVCWLTYSIDVIHGWFGLLLVGVFYALTLLIIVTWFQEGLAREVEAGLGICLAMFWAGVFCGTEVFIRVLAWGILPILFGCLIYIIWTLIFYRGKRD